MKPAAKTDRTRRRIIARRISYRHPETDPPYLTKQGSRIAAQRQADLAYLNDLFNVRL